MNETLHAPVYAGVGVGETFARRIKELEGPLRGLNHVRVLADPAAR